MKAYEPELSFDAASARLHDDRGDEEEAVGFLAGLADAGPVLELAIGTGRLALPLAARGLRVDGIDIAPAMLDRLREKPGGAELTVALGDFADVEMPDRYRLIFVAWNSFFNLTTQSEQVRCFENVAAHLDAGGHFVIEAYTPASFHRLQDDQQVSIEALEIDRVGIGLLRHDAATQTIEQSHVSLSAEGFRTTPVVQRYAWPGELDLMARIAGLRLVDRFADWEGRAFDSKSAMHVSVYGR